MLSNGITRLSDPITLRANTYGMRPELFVMHGNVLGHSSFQAGAGVGLSIQHARILAQSELLDLSDKIGSHNPYAAVRIKFQPANSQIGLETNIRALDHQSVVIATSLVLDF